MQNKATRIVTLSKERTSCREIYSKLNWLTVKQMIFYHSALSTWRIRESGQPEYLANILSKHNLRGNIVASNTRLTLAKNSYGFRCAVEWNSLPFCLRRSSTLIVFKRELRKWTLENVAPF